MKRMKILVLATAVQLGSWVSIAGEPVQRSAGQVQAAGWTGGTKVDVAPAPRIDPKATSAVSRQEQDSLETLARLAETTGSSTDKQRSHYGALARLLGLQPLSDQDAVAIMDVKIDERRTNSIFIRRPPAPAAAEVVFAHGVRGEDGKLRAYFHVTSSDGTLKKVVYKESGSDPVTLGPQAAIARYNEAVKFWKKWEQDYQKEIMNGDK